MVGSRSPQELRTESELKPSSPDVQANIFSAGYLLNNVTLQHLSCDLGQVI